MNKSVLICLFFIVAFSQAKDCLKECDAGFFNCMGGSSKNFQNLSLRQQCTGESTACVKQCAASQGLLQSNHADFNFNFNFDFSNILECQGKCKKEMFKCQIGCKNNGNKCNLDCEMSYRTCLSVQCQ